MRWSIVLSSEVVQWYETLGVHDAAVVDRKLELLATAGSQLRMPHSRALGGGLFEIRLSCEGVARRITYIFQPGLQIITLTTFRKNRNNEQSEVERARRGAITYKKRGGQR